MNKPANPLLALMEFERRIRSATSNQEVAFRAVNESTDALAFDQAIIWRIDALSKPIVVAASGLADITVDSPYQQWLVRLIRATVPEPFAKPVVLAFTELPEDLAADGEEWCRPQLLLCPLNGPDSGPLGGIIFMRAEPFGEQDRAAAEWIAQTTGFGLWAWRKEKPRLRRWLKGRNRVMLVGSVVLALALLAVVPVRLSSLAPAEISALKPIPVTSPVDAVVSRVVVKPNQEVKAGQVLAILDDTTIRNRQAIAEKALEIARADQQRVVYKAFGDEASRLELQVLEARVREKTAELGHLSEVLSRLTLTAPQGGVAVFSDADEWAGRSVQVGQRVMMIADPSLVDVTVYLAPEDALDLQAGGEVTVYLHTDPLSPLQAAISYASYEAVPAADGKLAYVVRAELAGGQRLPRVGLRGTAKISAGRVSLGFYLFRKPLGFLRRAIGI